MTVTLPENIPALQKMTEADVKAGIGTVALCPRAVSRWFRRQISASLNLFDFQSLLRDRRIPQHYDESDLEKDLLVLREL